MTFHLEVAESLITRKETTPTRRGRPRYVPSTNDEEEEINSPSVAGPSQKWKTKFQRPRSALKRDSFAHWPEKNFLKVQERLMRHKNPLQLHHMQDPVMQGGRQELICKISHF